MAQHTNDITSQLKGSHLSRGPASSFYQLMCSHSRYGQGGEDGGGADVLLPLFIAALVMAQPRGLMSMLHYVRAFHLAGNWAGQDGFQVSILSTSKQRAPLSLFLSVLQITLFLLILFACFKTVGENFIFDLASSFSNFSVINLE